MILSHGDGLQTTVQVSEYPIEDFELRVASLPAAMSLLQWCGQERIEEALVGGFYIREPQAPTDPLLSGMPLGELRSVGEQCASVPFDVPWGARRACIHSAGGKVTIAPRDQLPENLAGDLLQAGPMLVAAGRPADRTREGFSAGSGQFDSDITQGRHPRAALGIRDGSLLAVVTDGRTEREAGLTMDELAAQMLELGAASALNLDGGGSASMIRGGQLVNVPREGDGTEIPGGRPVSTALAFLPRR
ncbi:MAG: phosphodiester glycosidase family protein [Thermoleophilia bacterium]|nr:phosphodiester glycosidase family protein [Thermoleophilia bacterium]